MDMALIHTVNGFVLAALLIVTILLSAKAFTTLTPTTASAQAEAQVALPGNSGGAQAP